MPRVDKSKSRHTLPNPQQVTPSTATPRPTTTDCHPQYPHTDPNDSDRYILTNQNPQAIFENPEFHIDEVIESESLECLSPNVNSSLVPPTHSSIFARWLQSIKILLHLE
jgi:hypothetical protein